VRSAAAAAFGAWAASASLLCAPVAFGGVRAAIQGPTGVVAPNSDFDVAIVVTEAGSAFNGIDLIVTYDPAALTLVPRSPLSLQEGALMTTACATRFHRFRQGVDRDTITDVLLCAGASVTGPGEVYRLRFHASATPQVTSIRIAPASRFYQAGIAITPVEYVDATVGIGVALDATGEVTGPLRLRSAPNPFRSDARIALRTTEPGHAEVTIRDVSGRSVRCLLTGWLPAGDHALTWDGRTDRGLEVAAGVYYLAVRSGSRVVRREMVRVR
jgi:hypothetical protein